MTVGTQSRYTPRNQQESFTFFHHRWDVAKAWGLISNRESQEPDEVIDVAAWASQIFPGENKMGMFRVDTQRAMTDEIDTSVPLLLVTVSGHSLIIDGIHRLYKAWKTGVEKMPIFLLTKWEQRKVKMP